MSKMFKTALPRRLFVAFSIVTIASAAVLFSVGYFLGYRAGYEAAYLTPVRIGYLVADIHQIAFFVAHNERFYEEEGIRAIRLEYVNGPTQMMHFAAGDLEAGYVGVVPALMSKAKGGNESDFLIVASANLEGSAIIAKPEIKTVQDLNGKTVGTPGIGTIQASLLYMVEREFDIKVNARHYNGPTGLPLDFEKENPRVLDAYIAWEPFVAEAVVKGLGNVTYTSHDILPSHQCCVFYISGKMLREQPDIARKLVKIHLRAMKYVTERPNDAMEIFADRTGKSLEVVQESWKRMIWDYHPNITSMKTFVSYLIEQKKIASSDVQDVDQFVNNAVDTQILTEVEASGL